jgi:hypothetical protein
MMFEKDIINKKKEWVEPEITKGEDLSFTLVTTMAYGTHKENGDGCGILEKIITLGQC